MSGRRSLVAHGRNREMTVVPEPVSKKGINWG